MIQRSFTKTFVQVVSAAPSTTEAVSRTECIINAVKTTIRDAEFQEMVKEFLNTIKTIAKEEGRCIIDAKINIPKIIM